LKLSKRELQIVRDVFDNLKDDAMACDLGASRNTIHTYLHRLFAKLHVSTRTQMVVRIIQELLILTLAKQGSLPPICRHRVNGHCPLQV
jgi:DNA-binding NarL/FixJ family response regulator